MPKTSNKKDTFPFGQKIAWKPNKKWIAESNLSAFIKDHNLKDYDELIERSSVKRCRNRTNQGRRCSYAHLYQWDYRET